MNLLFEKEWYAAFVGTGEEDKVKERLAYRFSDRFRFFVPKRELRERKNGVWNNVLRTLFPGYVLINGSINVEDYYRFKDVPGMWKLLERNLGYNNQLLPIPDWEADQITRFISCGEIIGSSNLYEEGGQVRVIDGPLAGMDGQIVKVDRRKGRAKVRMAFMGEERIIDFAVNLLEKN